jgi:hypothetical protein
MTCSEIMAESALRLACDGDARGAKVYINGQLKGDCPSDFFIEAGKIDLKGV